MILETYSDGNFYGSKFKIATTDLNEYFPAYITYERRRLNDFQFRTNENNDYNHLAENVGNDVYLYRKPERLSLCNNASIQDTYNNLFYALSNRLRQVKYFFTYAEQQYHLNVIKGYIADSNDNILLLLTTKDFVIFNRDKTLKKDKLRLYVSTELIKNEIYKNLYKRLEKDYISKFYEEDIEVIFTTSDKIENSIYKNGFNVEFDDLTQLNNILEIEPNQILNYDFGDEDFEERVPRNIEPDTVQFVAAGEADLPF